MPHRPNILWIVTTQWRGQATGFAGDPNARTPCLDRLAATSTWFPRAVTPHPFGPFARAALLTGVASPQNGLREYYDGLPPDSRTIAHDLEQQGYETMYFGKWHLSRRDPDALLVGETHARVVVPPSARGGFRFWEGFESGFLLNDAWLHGTRLPEPKKFEGYQSDLLCERAGEMLRHRSKQNNPWFCVVSLEAPHPPYAAPAAGVDRLDAAAVVLAANVPLGGEVERQARDELAGYYAHIEATDRAVGRLLATVDASAPGTAVVFTSVHGDMHGAHGLFRKGWPHEESVRVPLLIRAPGEPRQGNIAASAFSLLDLRALTAAWAGIEHSRSLVTTHSLISMPSVVRLRHQCDRSWRGIRTATRKLVLNEDGSPWLFFNLAEDPGEKSNFVGEAAAVDEIAALSALIPECG